MPGPPEAPEGVPTPSARETLPDAGSDWAGRSSPAGWDAAPAAGDPEHPFQTPDGARYLRGALLGQGGMGRVVVAHDRRLRRDVAFKEVTTASARHGAVRDRLAQEAWITAQLEHPAIVPVYDAGEDAAGRRFYTMRLIRGRSLHELLAEAPDLAARLTQLRPVLDVCEAVAYAHSLGIVHRDLKPSNVMLGEFGEVQVVDWGLARPVGTADRSDGSWFPAVHAAVTRAGQAVGTPAYMSPEQARGGVADPRSDVWSLGAVLFALLTGGPPRRGTDPDAVLGEAKGRPLPPVASIVPEAPPELAAIVDRAVSFDPRTRYPDAKALAADLAAFVDGRRVRAYDYSAGDLLQRFVRAWRVPLVVAGLALGLVAGIAALAAVRTARERDRAVAAEEATRDALTAADNALGRALAGHALRAMSEGARPEAEVLAAHALALGAAPEARGVLAAWSGAPRPTDLASHPLPDCPAWVASPDGRQGLCLREDAVSLWDVARQAEVWHQPFGATDARFFDGRVLAYRDTHGRSWLDVGTGEVVAEDRQHTLTPLHVLPDGRTLSAGLEGFVAHGPLADVRGELPQHQVCGTRWGEHATVARPGGTVLEPCREGLVEATLDGEVLGVLPVPGISPGITTHVARAGLLFFGTTTGQVLAIDPSSGELRFSVSSTVGSVWQLVAPPSGEWLAVRGDGGRVELLDGRSGYSRGRLPRVRVDTVAVHGPDALTTLGATATVWRVPPPSARRFSAPSGLSSAAISPDGRWVTAHRGDGTVSVFDTTRGVLHRELKLSANPVKRGAFSDDGTRYVATAPELDGPGAVVLDVPSFEGRALPGASFRKRIGWLDDDSVWTVNYGENLNRYDLGADTMSGIPAGDPLAAVVFQDGDRPHGGAHLVALSADGAAFVGEVAAHPDGLVPRLLLQDAACVAVDGDGDTVLVGRRGELWRDDAGGLVQVADGLPEVLDVALRADGVLAASSHLDGSTRVWSVADGALLAVLRGHTRRVPFVRFTADGQGLLTASWDNDARLWALHDLDRPAAEVLAEVESAWRLDLDEVLRGL